MFRFIAVILAIVTAAVLTGGLSWFAIRNYRSAAPIAEEILRGLALTTATIMEEVAVNDTSLKSLNSLLTREVAYAAIIAANGTIIFHTNSDLTGSNVGDTRYQSVLQTGALSEKRLQLGTGETIYEFQTPLHLSSTTCILRLALHTWRAEEVMRRARQGITVIFSLLAVGWLLGLTVLWLLKRQAEQQRQAAQQKELARLGEVGAVLAHEVRNPLAGIKGYGQFLTERLPEGKDRGFAQLIVNEANHLQGLVNDILLYTRTESISLIPCRPAIVAESVLKLLTPQAQERSVKIHCHIPNELTVLCQEAGLRRVLLNLITNAIQASPDEGTIIVTGLRDGKWAEINVADNGPGISAEMQSALFEPFRTSKARGAGLGLAISKKIIDDYGGSIKAGPAPGGGALFSVHLQATKIDGVSDDQRTNPDR
ncbi:MAG: histidine kinase [Proteobacteria bacterium]|nr:histidine kinase [Desulfobulbaceae bacterium]MBU4151609.1 histidine kinase [Pseudomonadota bacterium]